MGVIALAPVTLADLHEQAGEALHLGGEIAAHDLDLGLMNDVGVAGRQPGEAHVAGQQGTLVAGVHEDLVDPVQEVVPGGSCYRPAPWQLLVPLEDLLHHEVGSAGRLIQAVQVALRVSEPVHVVDPQPVQRAVPDQVKDEAMGVSENLLVLRAQPGERLDVEEPPVGELLSGRGPVRQAVVLAAEQLVESVRVAIERRYLGVDRRRGAWLRLAQPGQPLPQFLDAAVALGHRRPVGEDGMRQAAEVGREALQLR